MKYDIQFTNQFKKDLKLAKKQNKNLDKLFEVIDILANGGTLDAKYRDHDLTGNYKGTRECHIEPDWLLIYEIWALIQRFSCLDALSPWFTFTGNHAFAKDLGSGKSTIIFQVALFTFNSKSLIHYITHIY